MSERFADEIVSTFIFEDAIFVTPLPVTFAIEKEPFEAAATRRPIVAPCGNTITSPMLGISTRRPTTMSAVPPATARSIFVALVV